MPRATGDPEMAPDTDDGIPKDGFIKVSKNNYRKGLEKKYPDVTTYLTPFAIIYYSCPYRKSNILFLSMLKPPANEANVLTAFNRYLS